MELNNKTILFYSHFNGFCQEND